jgi:hypothetical protein
MEKKSKKQLKLLTALNLDNSSISNMENQKQENDSSNNFSPFLNNIKADFVHSTTEFFVSHLEKQIS